MTLQPAYVDLAEGVVVVINGVPMRHLGGGQFTPAEAEEPLAKRFDANEGETLHRVRAA